jgi:hypothetical protein
MKSPFRSVLLALALVACSCLTAVRAQDETAYDPRRYVTEARVKEVYEAFQHLIRPEASPLSIADAREIVTLGTLSALALRCDLPWAQRIFQPMMARYRHGRKLPEDQMTIIGILHGFQQGTVMKEVPEGSCSAEIRGHLQKAMSKTP